MQQICDRVAGLDVHRDNVVACFAGSAREAGVVFEKGRFATTTAGLRDLEVWLADRQVELVAMEATGVYWKLDQLERDPKQPRIPWGGGCPPSVGAGHLRPTLWTHSRNWESRRIGPPETASTPLPGVCVVALVPTMGKKAEAARDPQTRGNGGPQAEA